MAAEVDIVIPVYNEALNIKQAMTRIAKEVTIPFKINIVYDFDEDNTLPVARSVEKEQGINVCYFKNIFGGGVLGAIKTGLKLSNAEFVVVTMADLSDPPSVIDEMYRAATRFNGDVICGSRYMPEGSQVGGPFLKRSLSKLAGLSLYWFTSIPTRDVTNSFKLYRREIFETITIESRGGFELGMEIVIKSHFGGRNVLEVPTSWTDRTLGGSRFRLWRWLPKYLRWYFYALRQQFFGKVAPITKRLS